jgi:hypothetical protein
MVMKTWRRQQQENATNPCKNSRENIHDVIRDVTFPSVRCFNSQTRAQYTRMLVSYESCPE